MSKAQVIITGPTESLSGTTPNPPPPPSEISKAAKALGSRPKQKFKDRRRRKRVWTGYVGGQKCWRGRLVRLADGRIAEMHRAFRGQAIVVIPSDHAGGAPRQICMSTRSLTLYKSPEAVTLGKMKRGIIEQKSPLKAAVARENGKRPAKFGHVVRGHPRKNAQNWQRFKLRSRNKLPRSFTVNGLAQWALAQQQEIAECLSREAERNREMALRASS